MPSQFAQNHRTTAFAALKILHGEAVVFIKGQTGKRRTVVGIVNRSPVVAFEAGGQKLVANVTVQVEQNATNGILITEINKGRDKIELETEIGTTDTRIIADVLETGGGALVLQLR